MHPDNDRQNADKDSLPLRDLETAIIGRWKSRLQDHAAGTLKDLFGLPRAPWPWHRMTWTVAEYSQESALRDALARQGRATELLALVPLGRQLGVRVFRGDQLIGGLNAEFFCDPVGTLDGALSPLPAEAMHARKARLDLALGVPCYHVFAGMFSEGRIEAPERTLVLNWRPGSGTWAFHEGQKAGDLWRLFHPYTDRECVRRILDCVSPCEPSLMRTTRLSELTGLSRTQIAQLSQQIPGARVIEDQGVSVFELATAS